MARRGLKTGQAVTLRSETGASLELAVTSDEGLPPQIVTLPQGRPAVNALTPPLSSPGFGAPYHDTFVDIVPKNGHRPIRSGP
jgi:anaerobic selenocysteine-containing dehydrogenase